jgi:hypothetical protein
MLKGIVSRDLCDLFSSSLQGRIRFIVDFIGVLIFNFFKVDIRGIEPFRTTDPGRRIFLAF